MPLKFSIVKGEMLRVVLMACREEDPLGCKLDDLSGCELVSCEHGACCA